MKHHKRASFVTYLMAALIAFVLTGATSSFAAKKTIHFYNDISGSPQLAVDADSGQVLWKETYKPYGERINNSPASTSGQGKNELYFHGKQQEALNGGVTIQYFGARYYDPSIGRFLGIDPVHFVPPNVHSFNRFAYGNNNPYRYVDPDGNAPVWAPLLIYLGGGAAAGAGGAAGISIASQYLMNGSVQWGGQGGVFDAMSEGAQIGMFLGPTLGAEAGAARAAAQISISKSRFPESAAHVQDAVRSGQPSVLTIDRAGAASRRREAMKGTSPTAGKDRDEYPPAMFSEGGKGASVRAISPSDNRGAGACIGAQCRGLADGAKVEMKVTQ
jgi:RHS repeat-associated protein